MSEISSAGFSYSLNQLKAHSQAMRDIEKKNKPEPETPFHEFGLKDVGASAQQENKVNVTDLQNQHNELLKEMNNPSKNFKLLG